MVFDQAIWLSKHDSRLDYVNQGDSMLLWGEKSTYMLKDWKYVSFEKV